MKKRKLAVLFGGCSSEYDISLQSAHAVLTHLDPGKYEPVPLGITPLTPCWTTAGTPMSAI